MVGPVAMKSALLLFFVAHVFVIDKSRALIQRLPRKSFTSSHQSLYRTLKARGGGLDESDSDFDFEETYDYSESENDEEEVSSVSATTITSKVSANKKKISAGKSKKSLPESETNVKSDDKDDALFESALAATKKAKRKKTSATKKTLDAELAKSRPKRKKKSNIMSRIPYIVRACANPFTVFSMTRVYFASLFDIRYLEKDSSQQLRSEAQDKAKKESRSGRQQEKKMRPGQAKTLSDLPQLSA